MDNNPPSFIVVAAAAAVSEASLKVMFAENFKR
jgi:hypothetical protein